MDEWGEFVGEVVDVEEGKIRRQKTEPVMYTRLSRGSNPMASWSGMLRLARRPLLRASFRILMVLFLE